MMGCSGCNDTGGASYNRSLCESAHAGILQDAQGTPIPQPCRFAANAAWLAVQVMAQTWPAGQRASVRVSRW